MLPFAASSTHPRTPVVRPVRHLLCFLSQWNSRPCQVPRMRSPTVTTRVLGARAVSRAVPPAGSAVVAAPVSGEGGAVGASSVRTSSARTPLHVRIEDTWYDLSAWRAAHPAGTDWIDMFRDRDATEVIHAFHSDVAHVMLQRLPKLTEPPAVAATVPAVTSAQRAFRVLRAQLLAEGWFERDAKAEAAHLAAWAACVALGVWAARQTVLPLLQSLAFLPLGLSFTAAGWLAHDYIHGRGRFCTVMRHFGGYAAGFGATMWSDKHNRHHALTNEVGQDEDLSGGPVLFLWAPDPSRDKAWRPKQGAYFLAAFSLLHWVWRVDSLLVSIKRKLLPELLPIMLHYAFFLALVPLSTFVAAVFLGGFVMANIVTTSHQSEELLFEPEHDWVRMQFRTTRDAEPGNAFSRWLWGGMQHQLEHHLFPTMPRYRYPALIPVIKAFAMQHDLPYKSESDWDIWWRTFGNYQRVAAAPAVPGAKGPRKGVSI